ncbi:hypothetical protein Hdeb2414_s0007g00238111 [Helianthus debilis subsp. tardiflorus]
MSSHFHTGISNCCSSPEGFWCSALTCEQVRHLDTYSAISFFIPIHQKFFLKSWYILLFPGCIVYLDLWDSSRILFLNSPC